MKKNQYNYTQREVAEIGERLIALIAALKLPDFSAAWAPSSLPEDTAPADAPPADAPPHRAYRVVGTRTPSRSSGRCPTCGDDMRISNYPDDDGVRRPYCHSCWSAKKH